MIYQVGGKPVIYLMAPAGSDVKASVKRSLVPEWDFSAVYPVVATRRTPTTGGEVVEWNVKACPDGSLLEANTGLEASYLFWEAEALKLSEERPISVALSCVGEASPTGEVFIPTRPHLDPRTAVVLEVATITPYLDGTLKSLGLHTEARTSIITHWPPSIVKHKYVALRSLPQTAYERAAPSEVSPTADVTVRVFMLFKGLKEEDVQGEWGSAVETADLDTSHWSGVVGVDGVWRMRACSG